MKIERVEDGAPAEEVRELTRAAFAGQEHLTPPSGALSETTADVAKDLTASGGVLVRDPSGRLVAACRVRRVGLGWAIRRVAVDPSVRRQGVGRALVAATHSWAVEAGALWMHAGVRAALPHNRTFWERLGYQELVDHGGWTELVASLPLVLVGVDETQRLGERLASGLRQGDLVVLGGPLGAGKTALTQGIGRGLGVRDRITSPTFVLARVHRAEVPLVHVDAYRLRDAGGRVELDDLDLDASLDDSITVVEWGDGLVEGLAESRLDVRLERPDDASRTASVRPVGPRWSVLPPPRG